MSTSITACARGALQAWTMLFAIARRICESGTSSSPASEGTGAWRGAGGGGGLSVPCIRLRAGSVRLGRGLRLRCWRCRWLGGGLSSGGLDDGEQRLDRDGLAFFELDFLERLSDGRRALGVDLVGLG